MLFFLVIILGLILNTIYLVREIRRNEQHDSFINAVTHELKTPIASIRLYLETLQRREVETQQRQQFYQLMLDDTDRLLGTVEQVLKAGEVGVNREVLHSVEVDFSHVGSRLHRPGTLASSPGVPIPCTIASIQATKTSSCKAIQTSCAPPLPTFSTTRSNIPANKVDVSVELRTVEERRAVLRVRDRGVGIPPEQLKRIFKRFYRVPGRSLSKVKGTGLGLFIVRAVARAHGGKVFAESGGEGKGTTVTFELPVSPSRSTP